MANCISCETALGALNTPLFGGKTNDGGKICKKCIFSIGLKGGQDAMKLTNDIKKYSTEEFKAELARIRADKEQEKQEKAEARQPVLDFMATMKKLNPSVAGKSELPELFSLLMEDETVEKIDSGYLDEGRGITGNGLIAATNYRIILIDKPTLGFGVKMEDFPYDKITSVAVETGLLKGVLKIVCSGNAAKINLVTGAKEFSEFVRQKTMNKPAASQPVGSEPDILAQIEKLAELKAKGILTEEEFNEKKGSLLAKL